MRTRPGKRNGEVRLPPYSEEAEKGVLGCMLLGGGQTISAARNVLGEGEAFYDLKHQVIYRAVTGLWGEGVPVDPITLSQRLKDTGRLEECGGLSFLAQLPETTPSAANLEYYTTIVGEKWVLRRLLKLCVEGGQRIYEWGGSVEGLLAAHEKELLELVARMRGADAAPKHLKMPIDFADGFWTRFFGGRNEEPGLELPIDFKLKVRMGETTLVSGDDGGGKSTMLSFWAVHLGEQMGRLCAGTAPKAFGATEVNKICIASFEMAGEATLWILASQLMGTREVPDSREGQERVTRSLGWLNKRFLIWDFLGIGDWREVLRGFRWAAERCGARIFILDSVMRIGIADDDYAQQGFAAAAFAQFAKETGSHLFFVVHENKSGEKGKARIRGSGLWRANADNIVRVERNGEKGQKLSDAWSDLKGARADGDEGAVKKLEEKIAKLNREWDSHVVLQKQRYPGTRQNASRYIWFDYRSFQYRTEWEETAVDWLTRWAQRHVTERVKK